MNHPYLVPQFQNEQTVYLLNPYNDIVNSGKGTQTHVYGEATGQLTSCVRPCDE
jgi:hypothetical protein